MHRTRQLWLLIGLVSAPVAACRDTLPLESPAELSFGRATAGASFDWSVPPRFGMDGDGDGLIDYPRTPEELHPASWTVNFDACALPQGGNRTEYRWFIDKRPVASVNTCAWSHAFPAEGSYEVALQVTRVPGPVIWAEQLVTVQDWLIVSFGDSYASGQGVPEVPGANSQLIASFEATFASLAAAQAHLQQMQANLASALQAKGFWESVLATEQQRLNDFLAACTDISNWSDVQACATFLAGVPFASYQAALNHFTLLRDNALDRFNDAVAALQSAQNAFDSAANAVANLQATLGLIGGGLQQAQWQAPYHNEDWQGEDCDRSANAAPARAARALEQADPRTSVTFVHLACTGATVDMHRANLISQIGWADELIGNREIDAVLMSIGGNDAGFASIALACGIQLVCFNSPILDPNLGVSSGLCFALGLLSSSFGTQCSTFFTTHFSQSAADIVSAGVAALPAKYAAVAQTSLPQLDGLLQPVAFMAPPVPAPAPEQRVRSGRVYITEYVDMTRNDNGAYCTFDPFDLLGSIPGISPPEMQWLDQTAAASINQAVAGAAAAHGWNAVGGIHSGYATHGYCANAHWVVRIYETFLTQGTALGVAHPNNAGHAHNAGAIFAALVGDLYPQGLAGAPRAPDQPLSRPSAASPH